jgi:hypothetical protein
MQVTPPGGPTQEQHQSGIEQGRCVIDELPEEDPPEKRTWSRRLENTSNISPEVQAWLEGLGPIYATEAGPYPDKTFLPGDTWADSPQKIASREVRAHLQAVRPISLGNGTFIDASTAEGSGEVTNTFNFLRTEIFRGQTCAVIQQATRYEAALTHLPSGLSVRIEGALISTLYRSVVKFVDLQEQGTGSLTAELFNLPVGKETAKVKVAATVTFNAAEELLPR